MQQALVKYAGSDSNGANLPPDIANRLQNAIQKKQQGRASTFHEDKAIAILEGLIDGCTTEKACENAGVPLSTWYVWRSVVPSLLEHATQARKIGAESKIERAQQEICDIDPAKLDPKTGQAVIRHAEVKFKSIMELGKCYNFELYGDKKQQLNVNLNATVSDDDVKGWFNK